jgi:hypothetical protein
MSYAGSLVPKLQLGNAVLEAPLPRALKAGAFQTWVPKLELGNQRNINLRALRAFVVIAFKNDRLTISG